MNYNITCIMTIWDEQNMIGLALASSKCFIDKYLILIQKCTDKTLDVIKYCQKKWNLNIEIINSDLKIRKRKELGIKLSKKYTDYYILQDGDEIFHDDSKRIIEDFIEKKYTFCTTPIILLENDLIHTTDNDNNIIMPNHPFFFKNLDDIYFPEIGDMPWYNPDENSHNILNLDFPLKFDCKIKNYRRSFLREVFVPWHDTNSELSIEEYAEKHHYHVIWYRKNIDKNLKLEEIIKLCEIEYKKDQFKWNNYYDEEKYYKYPKILEKFICKNNMHNEKNPFDTCQVGTLNTEQCYKSKYYECPIVNGSYLQCTNNYIPEPKIYNAKCDNRTFEMTPYPFKISENCYYNNIGFDRNRFKLNLK